LNTMGGQTWLKCRLQVLSVLWSFKPDARELKHLLPFSVNTLGDYTSGRQDQSTRLMRVMHPPLHPLADKKNCTKNSFEKFPFKSSNYIVWFGTLSPFPDLMPHFSQYCLPPPTHTTEPSSVRHSEATLCFSGL
jgi:hypothetical protein